MASSSKIITRNDTEHFMLGQPRKFSKVQLPTKRDIYLHYMSIKNDFVIAGDRKPIKQTLADRVAYDVEDLWKFASIPSVCHKVVREKIERVVAKAQYFLKTPKNKRVENHSKAKDFNQLFDICTCSCNFSNDLICSCSNDKKVPIMERRFLLDQREHRGNRYTSDCYHTV